jgi:hypothetical protein
MMQHIYIKQERQTNPWIVSGFSVTDEKNDPASFREPLNASSTTQQLQIK